jgi:hypothetical protein
VQLIYFPHHYKLLQLGNINPSSFEFQLFDASNVDGEIMVCADSGVLLPLDEIKDARIELSGFVKWDGCINWETDRSCMLHGCGPAPSDVVAVFTAIYAASHSMLETPIFEPPSMPDGVINI